jgi:hypothetical protein
VNSNDDVGMEEVGKKDSDDIHDDDPVEDQTTGSHAFEGAEPPPVLYMTRAVTASFITLAFSTSLVASY